MEYTVKFLIAGLLLSTTCFTALHAERRGRQQYYNPGQYQQPYQVPAIQHTPVGTRPEAPRYEEPQSPRDMEYNYRYALANPSENSLKVKVAVTNADVLAQKDQLFVVVEYTNLKHDATKEKVSVPVKFDEKNNMYFELPNLKEEAVYRLTTKLYTRQQNDATKGTFVKDMGTYTGVTAGKTELGKGRHKIVTTALLEDYDWQMGRRYLGNVPYNNTSGGWCGEFPYWCSKPYAKIFSENPSGDFSANGKFNIGGNNIPATAKEGAVHGDWAWWANNGNGHKMMILDYSLDSGTVYTIEGNLASRVGQFTRSLPEIGQFGHLTDGMLWAPKAEKETVKR